MLYKARAEKHADKSGEAELEAASRDQAVFKRVCGVMARALHPDTGEAEAATAMRVGRGLMAKHQLQEAAVIQQLQDQAKGQREPGCMCSVTLTTFERGGASSAKLVAGDERWWWEVLQHQLEADSRAKARRDDTGSSSSSSSGEDCCSDYEQEQSAPARKRQRPPQDRTQCMRVERYVHSIADAIKNFASVECFSTNELEHVTVTFYGVAAQAQIAAYQLELAINSATAAALRQSPKAKATELVDYMMGFGKGLLDKVGMMAQAQASNGHCKPPPPPPSVIKVGCREGQQQQPVAVAQPTPASSGPVAAIKTEPVEAGAGRPLCRWEQLQQMEFSKKELCKLREFYLAPAKCRSRRPRGAEAGSWIPGSSCRMHKRQTSLWRNLTKDGKDAMAEKWPKPDLLFVLRCMKLWELEQLSLGPLPKPLRVLIDGDEGDISELCEVVDLTADEVDLTAHDKVDDISQYVVQLLFPPKVKAEPIDPNQQGPAAPAAAPSNNLEPAPLPQPAHGIHVGPQPHQSPGRVEPFFRDMDLDGINNRHLEHSDEDDPGAAGGWASGAGDSGDEAAGSRADQELLAAQTRAAAVGVAAQPQARRHAGAAAAHEPGGAAEAAAEAVAERMAAQQIVLWQQQSKAIAAEVLKEHNIKLGSRGMMQPLKRKVNKQRFNEGHEKGLKHQLGRNALPQPQPRA